MSMQANQAVYQSGMELPRFRPGRVLMVFSLMMLAGLLYWAVQQLVNPLNVPVNKIRVQGSFVHVTEAMLAPLSKQLSGVGYFDIDVTAVQQKVESLPWIEHAMVRRIWPDTLAIHFTEREALAVWAEGGLLSTRGEIFKARESTYPSGLPVFYGPEKLRDRMRESHRRFVGLLAPLDMSIRELKLDERQSWQIVLDNGMHLKLGREYEFDRLARFVRSYPQIKAMDRGNVKRVDLRYTNGMAVAWK